MVAPWDETALRVVVEFKKGNSGVKRVINLTHSPDVLPQQLYGRISPEVWRSFMVEVQALAGYHPYTQRQDVGQCCYNLQGLFCWCFIGFGFFNPDGGNYAVWTREVRDCITHHQQFFNPGGCQLSLQCVHGSYWIQIDVTPNVAVGVPMGASVPPPGYPAAPAPGPYPYPYPPPLEGGAAPLQYASAPPGVSGGGFDAPAKPV